MPSEAPIQQVFDLLYFFHPQEATALAVTRYVVNQVYPTTAHQQQHQLGYLPRVLGRFIQIIPTRQGLYQFSAFTGSEHWEKDQETGTHRLSCELAEQYCPTPADLLGRYVKILIRPTVRHTPLRVAGALGRLLWHYSAPDILCLLPDARDQVNVHHHHAALLQTITDRFPYLGVKSGPHGANTVCTVPPSDAQRQFIKAALWTLHPWWIPHVPLYAARSDNEQIHTFICPGCRGFDCASMARSDNAQIHTFICPRTPSHPCDNTPPHPCGGFAEVIHQYNAGLPRGSTMLDKPDDRLRIPDFQTPGGGSPSDEDPGGSEPASSGGTPLPIASRLHPPHLTPEQIDSVRADASHQRRRRRLYRRGLLHIYVDGTRRPDARPGQPFTVSLHASSVEVFGRDAEGDLLLAVFPLPDLDTLEDAPVPQLSVRYGWGHSLQLDIQPVRQAPGEIPEGLLQLTHRVSALAPVVAQPVVRYACVALLAAAVGGAGVRAFYSRDLHSLPARVARAEIFEDIAASKIMPDVPVRKRSETLKEVQELEQRLQQGMYGGTYKTATAVATVFMYAKDFETALEWFAKAQALDPDKDEPYKAMAAIYKIKGNHQQSIYYLEQLLQKHPKDHETLNYLGWSYSMLGQESEARTRYQQALAHRGDYADALFNLALVYQRQGNPVQYQAHLERARHLLDTAIAAYPTHARAYFELAKTYAHAAEWEQAHKQLQQAIALDPEWAFWVQYEPFFEPLPTRVSDDEIGTIRDVADIYVAHKIAQAKALLPKTG